MMFGRIRGRRRKEERCNSGVDVQSDTHVNVTVKPDINLNESCVVDIQSGGGIRTELVKKNVTQ
jgi:hypothetical protein